MDVLLQRADVAVYQAKRGHLGTAVHDTDSGANGLERLSVRTELRAARCGGGGLYLLFQPTIRAALLRWEHRPVV